MYRGVFDPAALRIIHMGFILHIQYFTAHTKEDLQRLTNQFAYAYTEFRLPVCLKKTTVLCQDATELSSITIDNGVLEATDPSVLAP